MGCLSVIASPQQSAIVIADKVGGAVIDAHDAVSHPSVTAKVVDKADISVCRMNVNVDVSAWLVCTVNLNEEFLAVNEGFLLTIDGEYLKVRRM